MTKKTKNLTIWQVVPINAYCLLALAANYLQYLKEASFSAKTIHLRRCYLGYFLSWCNERGIVEVREVSRGIMEKYNHYLCELKSKKTKEILSIQGRHAHLRTVSLFFSWLVERDYLIYNVVSDIELPQLPSKLPTDVLVGEEVEQILNQADIKTSLGIRDRAMMETLYSTGIRACEVRNLNIYDVDIERGILMVVEGKGKKDRLVPIGERAIKWLEKYLHEVRPLLALAQEKAVFVTQYGKAFSQNTVLGSIISEYKKAAGIEKQGGCHLFRRSMATLMLENGASIRYIQEILGHEYLSTTEIYTRVSIEHLKKVHSQTHPAENCNIEQKIPEKLETKPLQRVSTTRENPMASSDYMDLWGMQPTSSEGLVALAIKYLNWMKTSYAVRTIEDRARHLRIFLQWCSERCINKPSEITKVTMDRYNSHICRYRNKHNGEALSAAYKVCLLSSLSCFFLWLIKNGYLLFNPVAHIKLPKVPNRLPRSILSAQEAEKVLQQPNVNKILGVRDRAILEILYSTGIRRHECANLQINDIQFQRNTLVIKEGKGKKDRLVPIGNRVLDWLEKYLNEVRPLLIFGSDDPSLFFTKYGKPLTAKGMGTIVRQYVDAADIGKKGACYLFRHSAATLMLDNGADIRHIKEILGHNCINSTQIYTKVSIKKLKEIHDQTHPAKMTPTKTREIIDDLEKS